MKLFSVDHSEPVDLEEFLRVNLHSDDVESLTEDEIERILKLEVKQSVFIGVCEVERVA